MTKVRHLEIDENDVEVRITMATNLVTIENDIVTTWETKISS